MGSKVPPRIPMRMFLMFESIRFLRFRWVKLAMQSMTENDRSHNLFSELPVSFHNVLIGSEAFEPHGAPGMNLVG